MDFYQSTKTDDLINKFELEELLEHFYYIKRRYSILETIDVNDLLIKNNIFTRSELYEIECWALRNLKSKNILPEGSPLSSKQKHLVEKENEGLIHSKDDGISYLKSEFNLSNFNFTSELVERYKRLWLAKRIIDQITKTIKKIVFRFKWKYRYYHLVHDPVVRYWYPTALVIYISIVACLLIPYGYSYVNYRVDLHNWENFNKNHTIRVYKTRTGSRYHKAYHYSNRNEPVDLFSAYYDLGLTPCHTCNPPDPNFTPKPKPPESKKMFFLIPLYFIGLYLWPKFEYKHWYLHR